MPNYRSSAIAAHEICMWLESIPGPDCKPMNRQRMATIIDRALADEREATRQLEKTGQEILKRTQNIRKAPHNISMEFVDAWDRFNESLTNLRAARGEE